MKKPFRLVERSAVLDATSIMQAESDEVAGQMLLVAFGKAVKDIEPELANITPIDGDPIKVVVTVQAWGYEK